MDSEHSACINDRTGYRWTDVGAGFARAFVCEWEPEAAAASGRDQTDLTRGLIGWWKFDEAGGTVARDSSGKGNHGAVKGGGKWVKGRIGGALEFDGSDDHFVADPEDWTATAYSVTLWVKASELGQGAFGGVFSSNSPGSNFQLDVNGGDPGNYRFVPEEHTIGPVTMRWAHLGVTWDGSRRRLYYNGILASVFPALGGAAGEVFGVYVLGQNRAANSHFAGSIDDVRIYDRALSAQEVALLANPERLAAIEAAGRAKSEADERLSALHAEFDALVAKGDFSGARDFVSREARKRENRPHADALRAASRVADALATRRDAMVEAAGKLVGKQIELVTSKGKLAGKLGRVTDDGIVLEIKKKIRGMGTIETKITVKWAELDPKDEARLAKGWKPEGPDAHVAMAALALARKDAAAAGKALASAGGHPLAAHYGAKLGGGPKPEAVVGRPAGGWPPDIKTVRKLFRGKVLKWDPETLEIELGYDFSDQRQIADWFMSTWSENGVLGGQEVVRGGVLKMMGTRQCALHRAVFEDASIGASASAVGGSRSPCLVVRAQTEGDFVSLAVNGRGTACLQGYVGGRLQGLYPDMPFAFRAGQKLSMYAAITDGQLEGRVDALRMGPVPAPSKPGHVGFRGYDTEATFDNARIKGRLNRMWLEVQLGLRDQPGLLGTYYRGIGFEKAILRRIDPRVSFRWEGNPPGPGVPQDNFCVRWEGSIVPPETGTYTFYLSSDDKSRLWIAGTIVISAGTELRRPSQPLGLQAGKAVPVQLEHEEGVGGAMMELLWTGPGIHAPVPVPAEALRPPKGYEKLTNPSVEIHTAAPGARAVRDAGPPAKPAAKPAAKPTAKPTARRGWPPDIKTIRGLFKGKLLKWDPRTLAIELAYDFSDEGQAADWAMSSWVLWGSVPRGFTVANGSMELMGSGNYVFHKASLVEASIEASATVTGGWNSPGCVVCADESGSFHSLAGHFLGKAYLESFKGGTSYTDRTPRTAYSIREGMPTRISLGIDRSGRLAGGVGELRFSSDPVPGRSGHVGLRAFRSNAAFRNVRVKGRFSRPWLEQALGRPATRGLLGTYFGTRDLSRPVARRIDPAIDFDWGTGKPMTGMPADGFGVRWEGWIVPPRTGLYVLRVHADDSVRVWVAGRVVLDAQRWDPGNVDLASKPFGGEAGRPLPLRVEHGELDGNARVHVRWTAPGFRTPSAIPAECLRPPKGYEKLPGPPLRK
ncbi:MAG: PA14 domain-containing protein [Planctomycetota bacterium]|jgi:hypothetical protein